MRSAILLGFLIMAYAINNRLFDNPAADFCIWVLLVFMFMDLLEYFIMLWRQKK